MRLQRENFLIQGCFKLNNTMNTKFSHEVLLPLRKHQFFMIINFIIYLAKIIILGNYIKLELENLTNINIVLNFLKNHTKTKFNILVDIACVDFLNFKKSRFIVNYFLLSYSYNSRIAVSS